MRRTQLALLLLCIGLSALFASVVTPVTPAQATDAAKVLVRGAPIHGANGIIIGARGTMYVGSVFGRDIVLVRSRTGRIIDRLGPADGYNGADDVAIAPDGSLYWTDTLEGRVGHRALNGAVSYQAVAPFVNPLRFTEDGRLFVGQAFFGDSLYEVDPDFVDPPVKVWGGSGVPPFLDQLNGFDFGPDGRLYAPQPFQGRVIRLVVDTWVPEVVVDDLAFPVAVKFDSRGKLFAALQGSGTVVRINRATHAARLVAKLQPGLDNLAFDARDHLFVSHAGNGRLWRILPSGERRRLVKAGLVMPGGIAVRPGKDLMPFDQLWVADGWEIKRYDGRNGQFGGVLRQSFSGDSIIAAQTVSADGANLILTSWLTNAVQVWAPATGQQVGYWNDFGLPVNAIRFGEDLIVADGATHSVISQTPGGVRTTLSDAFAYPTGLAASAGDLYVADLFAGTVSRVVDDGVTLAVPAVVAADLLGPEGLAVDGNGMLLVVEAGAGRLTRIDPGTGAKTLVRDRLALGAVGSPSMPPHWFFNGVAVGAGGDIYVTGDKRSLIYRIK